MRRQSPPCIAARRGGGVIKKYCEATEADTAGVVFLIVLIGKPPRPRYSRLLRAVFLIARPPLLAVMQGGDYCLISIHSHVRRPPLQSTRRAGALVLQPSLHLHAADGMKAPPTCSRKPDHKSLRPTSNRRFPERDTLRAILRTGSKSDR